MKKYEITATRPNGRQVTIVTKHAEKAQWVKRDFEAEGCKVEVIEFEVDTRTFAQMVIDSCRA